MTSTNGTLTREDPAPGRHVDEPARRRAGPTTVAIPPQAVHVPIAAPRSCSSAKVAAISASDAGVSRALVTPCSARAATSGSIVGASAQRSDARPKRATPSAKIRRCP